MDLSNTDLSKFDPVLVGVVGRLDSVQLTRLHHKLRELLGGPNVYPAAIPAARAFLLDLLRECL